MTKSERKALKDKLSKMTFTEFKKAMKVGMKEALEWMKYNEVVKEVLEEKKRVKLPKTWGSIKL